MEKQIKLDETVGLLPEEESQEMSTPTGESVEITADMTMLDFVLMDGDREIFHQAKKIKDQMESLASTLTRAAKNLDTFIANGDYKAWHSVNSLGEVQSRGASIDNAIGRLDGLRDGRAALDHALRIVKGGGAE